MVQDKGVESVTLYHPVHDINERFTLLLNYIYKFILEGFKIIVILFF